MIEKTKGIYLSAKDTKDLRFLLNYIIDAEQKSYEEYVCQFLCELPDKKCNVCDVLLNKKLYNKPDINHIYAFAMRVKDAVEYSPLHT